MKNSGFSKPPAPCSLAAFLDSTACTKPDGSAAWFLIRVIVHGPQQETFNQCRNTYAHGKRQEHQQKFGLNSNHVFWKLQNGQLEKRNSDHFSNNAIFPQHGQSMSKTESPIAAILESPLAGFGEYISCSALRILALHVWRGSLHYVSRSPSLSSWVCVCLFQTNMTKLERRSSVFGNTVRVLAIRLWAIKSTFSVQKPLAHRTWNRRWP